MRKGVCNLLVGGKPDVDVLLRHPDVNAISFVGSTPVARYIYPEGAAHFKRVQCQGGAKNYVVVMPDADLEMSAKIVADSASGCAGQRCLALSAAITIGDASKTFTDSIVGMASQLRVRHGLDEGTQMGPVISPASKTRIEGLIAKGLDQGARVLLDGRNAAVAGRGNGAFLKPTILTDVNADNELTGTAARRRSRRSDRDTFAQCLRQRRFDFHDRSRGPHGIFPLQRLEGQLYGRSSRPGPRRRWPKDWSRKF